MTSDPIVSEIESPKNADGILTFLTENFEDLPPHPRKAARYILDAPREVGVHSMRELARKAGVHPNTLVRLARRVGYASYEAFRERFRDFLISDGLGGIPDRARWLSELERREGAGALIAAMARSSSDNVEEMWRRNDPDTLTRAADTLVGARRVYTVGVGTANAAAAQFVGVTSMAFDHIQLVPSHGASPVDDLTSMGAQDAMVALTFQPYRAETLAAAEDAQGAGIPIIGITDSETSPLSRIADTVLIAPTHTPLYFQSHAAVSALLEGLIAVMVSHAGDEAIDRIARFHQRRQDAGLYREHAALVNLPDPKHRA